MADFKLKVSAETQEAQKNVEQLDKKANEAAKERKLRFDIPNLTSITKSFDSIEKNIKDAANNIQTFYKISKNLPGIGDTVKRYENAAKGTAKLAVGASQNIKAGQILTNTFDVAGSKIEFLINRLAKLGFALFGIREIVGVLQQAFGGFFDQTVGREIRLRETILKTQTTLASTSKVFKNGKEITDPYEKIIGLTGAVRKNIDSIRERSIALAGVTSNDVIEVFGIVASQISQIGGGLKEAEDLAINFSAALGTFGIPLYQARQEIGSILRGDITMDSLLAKSLGITNEDIAKAKSQAGGVVKFLEDRLAAAVAGQKIAAQGFSGVVSNIRDLGELVGQRFGAKLLDPMLNGLSAIFETLFKIREQIFSVADGAGEFVGRFASLGQSVRSRSKLVTNEEIGIKGADTLGPVVNNTKDAIQDLIVLIEGGLQRSVGAVSQIILTLKPALATVTDAFIRLGKSFIEIKVDIFESLARALANVISVMSPFIQGFATLFNIYSRLLDLPLIQEFSKLAATYDLLKRAGMDFATNLFFIGRTIVTAVIPAIGGLGSFIAALITGIAAVTIAAGKLALVLGGLAAAVAGLPMLAGAVGKAFLEVSQNLEKTGGEALSTGGKLERTANGFRNLGDAAKLAGMNVLKSLGWTLLIQLALTAVVNAIGEFQKANEEATRTRRAEQALDRLSTVYRNIGDDADYATKAARDFDQQLASAEYGRATEELEKIEKKLNDLEYEAKSGIQTWGELWRILGRVANFQADPYNTLDQKDASKTIGEQFKLREYQRKYEAQQNKKQAEENIRIEAENRINLEKEINDIRLRQENELFQKRQEIASQEVEAFRLAGQLRIYQMEEANAKLLEGEEGASRSALEALTNYLKVREEGELDIEANKRNLAIEVANMEKEIENYKLENAKTIAEIKKKSAKYEEEVAKNIETIKRNGAKAAAANGASVAEGYRVGSSGRSTGAHLDIRGNDASSVRREALEIIKSWQSQGIEYIQLSNAKIDVKNMKSDAALDSALKKEQIAHDITRGRRIGASRNAIDIAVPAGTLVPRRTGTPHWDPSGGGWTATSMDTGNEFLHGQEKSVASRGAAPTPVSTQAPDFNSAGTSAVQKYSEAVRSLAASMERVRALQQALTEAKTKSAFETVAKAAFPTVSVEQYTDQMIEAQASLDAYRKVSGQAYDPTLLKIAADEQAKIAINAKEIKQLENKLQELRKENQVTTEEQKKLEKDIADRKNKYLQDLKKEREEREKLLKIQREEQAVRELSEKTRSIPFDLRRAQAQAMGSMASAYAGDDPVKQRQIQAEQQILDEKIRLEQEFGEGSNRATTELVDFAAKTRGAAVVLGEMDKQVLAFNGTMATIRDISKTMTDGMKGFVKTILTGGDIQEGLKQMLEGMSSKFLDLALDAAFKPMEQQLEAQLKRFLGLEDPKVALQAENNAALKTLTTAVDTLNTTIGGSATGQNPATPATPGGVISLPVVPFAASGSSGSKVTEAEGAYVDALGKATSTKNEESKQGEATTAKQFDFGKALSGATQAFGAISMGIGGAQQMGKGGTYNTLMGLAGIFGALGSITGMFGTGGIFAGKPKAAASGGPVRANRPYLVGEIGPELFLPNSDGEIVSNAKSRKLLSAAALAGKSQTFADNAGARQQAAPSKVRFDFTYQSEVINNTEYVTADQFQKGMIQSAERGRALALSSLQNSVRDRRRIGMA